MADTPTRTQVRFWLNLEFSKLITDAAEKTGMIRSRYIQLAIKDGIIADGTDRDDLDYLLPYPHSTRKDLRLRREHARGQGRWSEQTNACTVGRPALPAVLYAHSVKMGDASVAAMIRRFVAAAVERDLGIKPPTQRDRNSLGRWAGPIYSEVK